MNDAKLYHKANNFQKKDAEDLLNSHMRFVRWKKNDTILDVGSGEGYVLANVLLKNLPDDYESIVAADVSPEMVDYGKKLYADDRISFEVMDISTPPKQQHLNRYNHIFSFNCLHWVQDQKMAFRNIYEMLQNDGDCVIGILAKANVYDLWKFMSQDPRWEKYMKDVDKFISPYNNFLNPVHELKKTLYEVGFKSVHVEMKHKVFEFDSFKTMINSAKAVNPFINRIPIDLREDYMNHYVEIAEELGSIERDNNNVGEKLVTKAYNSSLYIYASKI